MCIIVAKDKKAKLPANDILNTCFYNNGDGAGFMYVDNGKVVIDKGYMTLKSFKKHYKKLCEKYNNFDNKSLVIHFRIGTSGSNSVKNCHPFPVDENIKNLQKPYFLTDLGIAHNGIIRDYIPAKNDIDISDTQNFIYKFLSQMKKISKDFYKNKGIMDGIENLIASKLCLLNANDELYYVGDFIEDNGIMYSNSTYKYSYWSEYNKMWGTSSTSKNTSYPLEKYDDFDDDDYFELEHKYNDEYVYEDDLVKLQKGWYYTTLDGTKKEVTENNLYIDKYEGNIYEQNVLGDYIKRADDVFLYDKNGEELYLY